MLVFIGIKLLLFQNVSQLNIRGIPVSWEGLKKSFLRVFKIAFLSKGKVFSQIYDKEGKSKCSPGQ